MPNPINYFQLAQAIDVNQQGLLAHVSASQFSLTTPQTTGGGSRAINPIKEWGYLPNARSQCRASVRYILQTDINNFYPSIYTHVIPWSLHGKLFAKQHRFDYALIGNVLDLVIRNSQDQQTLGIDIGPDCSLVIAEIILSTVDAALSHAGLQNGFRYLDDYEFGFSTYAQAEQGLADLQGKLGEYELHLNPSKTHVFELPATIEHPWATELRRFGLRGAGRSQEIDLTGYFSRAYELAHQYVDQSVLRFALGRMRRTTVDRTNWSLYESILLQIASVEPGALNFVVDELYRYHKAGYGVDLSKVAAAFRQLLSQHARVNHGSEVAWTIWGCLLFGLKIDDYVANELVQMEDSIVAILALDANAKGLMGNNFTPTLWESMMDTQSLYDENWLLSYEANVKGWLPSLGISDHVALDPGFSFLKQNSVSFYDESLALNYQPSPVALSEGGTGDQQSAGEQPAEASG